jgi:hypothetical protein
VVVTTTADNKEEGTTVAAVDTSMTVIGMTDTGKTTVTVDVNARLPATGSAETLTEMNVLDTVRTVTPHARTVTEIADAPQNLELHLGVREAGVLLHALVMYVWMPKPVRRLVEVAAALDPRHGAVHVLARRLLAAGTRLRLEDQSVTAVHLQPDHAPLRRDQDKQVIPEHACPPGYRSRCKWPASERV